MRMVSPTRVMRILSRDGRAIRRLNYFELSD
jgi:hypothetical protein